MKYLILALTLLGCASASEVKPTDAGVDREKLLQLRAQIEAWVKPCEFEGVEYPCERSGDSTNEDHATLWAGLSCLADDSFCDGSLSAQSDDGKVWRSPSQIGVKDKNSSSRDMFLGFLAAVVKTGEQDAAWRAYQYIRAHSDQLCTDADDNRCDMRRIQYKAIWGTMRRVFQHIGLKTTPTMDDAARGDDEILLGEAGTSPVGYKLHLVSIQLHIRKFVGKFSNWNAETAKVLVSKDKNNAYFLWLAGKEAEAAEKVLDQCPENVPGQKRNDWIWSQGSDSMGYDCLFMISLLLNE